MSWTIQETLDGIAIIELAKDGQRVICRLAGHSDETKAHARIIAAAPKLLKVCKFVDDKGDQVEAALRELSQDDEVAIMVGIIDGASAAVKLTKEKP